MSTTEKLLDEVARERCHQDAKWGGPAHDDQHTTWEFIGYILRYAKWAADAITETDSGAVGYKPMAPIEKTNAGQKATGPSRCACCGPLANQWTAQWLGNTTPLLGSRARELLLHRRGVECDGEGEWAIGP